MAQVLDGLVALPLDSRTREALEWIARRAGGHAVHSIIVLEDAQGSQRQDRAGGIGTFLIADLRGYTRYTQEHGDEAASKLAHRFAEIVRGAIGSSGGKVVELRGDEALCVFSSAREALSGAIELQRRSRADLDDEPALPLGVGVGLDAGEAVPTEGGYRGGALNVAARLCALARPGEILASETVTSLAGRHEEASYAPRRAVRLKGIGQPVRHGEIVPGVPLPPLPRALPKARTWRLGGRWALALALGIALTAALIVGVISRDDGGESAVPPGSVAAIDPKTNSVVWDVSVGGAPTELAVSGGKLWILNRAQTVSLVDARTRSLVKTFAIGATPAGIAAGASGVWAGDNVASTVLKLNPENALVVDKIHAPPSTPPPLPSFTPGPLTLFDAGQIALGHDAVWFLSGNATLSRIDPAARRVRAIVRTRGEADGGPADVVVGEGGVWVFAWSGDLTRIDPRNNSVVASASVGGTGPLAAGGRHLWLVDNPKHLIWQIDPGSPGAGTPPTVVRSITVGQNPVDVAFGLGSVWVASGDGTVSRIDPIAARVVETIPVGGNLGGIAVGDGSVWVTVD